MAAAAAQGDEGTPEKAGPLVLEKTLIEYGVVEQDAEYTAEVSYENKGNTQITKLRAKAGCSCASIGLSETALAPGAHGKLTARFRTHGFLGVATKKVNLLYDDDGTSRRLELKLKISVIGGVLIDRLHLGEVLEGTAPEGTALVRWHVGVGTPFEIKSVTVPGQPIETKVEPYEPGPGVAYKGWLVHFRFTEPPPKGIFSAKAVVVTTHPKQGKVLLALTARVLGKVWVQTSHVYLGLVAEGKGKSASVTFRGFNKTIKLGKVSARARKGVLQVSIKDTVTRRGPAKKLTVTVPKDAPPGSLDDVIELHTEVPGEKLVTINVRGRIFVPAKR